MRGIICFLIIIFALTGVWATIPPAPSEVQIAPQDGGGYLITSPVYKARIGADGNLHSLQVQNVEFLDDTVPGSAGASFYVRQPRPLPLPTLTLDGLAITATDGTNTIRYEFQEGYFAVNLRHANPKGAAYALVASPRITYVENLAQKGVAAAPADYDWPDVLLTVPTGEYLELHGGSRIWGRALGRQVWERSNMAPNKDYGVVFIPGQGVPRQPDLSQLTSLTATIDAPDNLAPGGAPVALRVRLQNNANQEIHSDLAVRVESSAGAVLLDERKPIACDPHQAATLNWQLEPKTPEFYTMSCSVNLNGAISRFTTTFGYQVEGISLVSQRPTDFDEYWNRVVAEAQASEAKLARLEEPNRSTSTVKVYRVGLEGDGMTCFGWLAVPTYPGKYPAIIQLPGDRVRHLSPNAALANGGMVILTLEPTGQPIDRPLKPFITQVTTNLTDPTAFGLRAVVIRYLRAITALSAQPEVDPNRIAVTGVSLGGGLAMILGGLDERIQAVAPDVPYYCYIEAGKDSPTWPYLEIAAYLREHPDQQEAVLRTLRYYDVANFAERLSCPVLISAGVNDPYSRPATIYGVFNRLPGPRVLRLYQAGHEGGGAKHWEEKLRWLTQVLGGASPAPSPATGEAAKP